MPNCRSEQAPGSVQFSVPLDREPSQNDSKVSVHGPQQVTQATLPKATRPNVYNLNIEEDNHDLIVLKHGPVRFSLLQDWRVLSGPLM